MGAKTCTGCGQELLNKAKFCHKCGGVVLGTYSTRILARHGKSNNTCWKIVGIILIMASVFSGVYLVRSGSQAGAINAYSAQSGWSGLLSSSGGQSLSQSSRATPVQTTTQPPTSSVEIAQTPQNTQNRIVSISISSPTRTTYQPLTSNTSAVQTPQNVRQDQQVSTVFSLNTRSSSLNNTDSDCDGLSDSRERGLGTDPNNADTDRDGLSDGLEVNTLSSYGANPLRKDIFVEVDRMSGVRSLNESEKRQLVDAFKNAPLSNPDGSQGVDLHLYFDDVITPSKSISIKTNDYRNYQQRYHDYPAGFRWALLAKITGEWYEFFTPIGGFCWGEGFVVDPGLSTIPFTKTSIGPLSILAMTFMHELGHSLGLMPGVYGGIDSLSWPWNYNSVMNYSSWNVFFPWHGIDYSRGGAFNDWEYLSEGFTNYWWA